LAKSFATSTRRGKMKKALTFLLALTFIFVAATVTAKKPTEEAPVSPSLISASFEMQDGEVIEVDFPTEGSLPGGVGTESTILPPIIILPPIYIWQAGWFPHDGSWFFGWVGPNGFLHIMAIDQSGILHYWVWTTMWVYMGTL